MTEQELEYIKNELNLPYLPLNTGKFIRSRIVLLLLKGYNLKINQDYLDILVTTELIHNASILHDDILDNETVRRNAPSVRTKYGDKVSLLYGNLTLITAIKRLLHLNSTNIIEVFNNVVENMCRGELLQNEQLYTVPMLEDYLRKTELKTAELFIAPLKAISLLTALPSEFVEFARNFGIAFQIKNDLDNVLTLNSDYEQGIYTAPIIFKGQNMNLEYGIEKTLSLIDNYIKEGVACLSIMSENKYKQELIGVVECLKRLEIGITNLDKTTRQ